MEFVYVMKSQDIPFAISEPTFRPWSSKQESRQFLDRLAETGFFVERKWAESDPQFKQIIPYVVIRSEQDPNQVLLLERKSSQTESRLHHKLSVGIGGHINPVDGSQDGQHHPRAEWPARGLEREISEELLISHNDWQWEWIGWVFDGSNAVGSVHFGLVAQLIVPKETVAIRETEKMMGRFESLTQIVSPQRSLRPRLESWSQLVADTMSSGPVDDRKSEGADHSATH